MILDDLNNSAEGMESELNVRKTKKLITKCIGQQRRQAQVVCFLFLFSVVVSLLLCLCVDVLELWFAVGLGTRPGMPMNSTAV